MRTGWIWDQLRTALRWLSKIPTTFGGCRDKRTIRGRKHSRNKEHGRTTRNRCSNLRVKSKRGGEPLAAAGPRELSQLELAEPLSAKPTGAAIASTAEATSAQAALRLDLRQRDGKVKEQDDLVLEAGNVWCEQGWREQSVSEGRSAMVGCLYQHGSIDNAGQIWILPRSFCVAQFGGTLQPCNACNQLA